jgi:hypothetical protein
LDVNEFFVPAQSGTVGRLHEDHHIIYDILGRPWNFAEIVDWFANESVPDTAFDSDVFDVHLEPSVLIQHSSTSPADSPIPGRSLDFRRHCKSFFSI